MKSSTCAGLTCAQVGLAMKNNMKNIPGKPNSLWENLVYRNKKN